MRVTAYSCTALESIESGPMRRALEAASASGTIVNVFTPGCLDRFEPVVRAGAPTLSKESYPFADVWPALHRVLDAFGLDRVMWGTDFTRVLEVLTYADDVNYVLESSELSDSDRERFMGGTLRTIYGWPRV